MSSAPVVSVKRTSNVIGKEVLAPEVAIFSSRGPSILPPGVLKVSDHEAYDKKYIIFSRFAILWISTTKHIIKYI